VSFQEDLRRNRSIFQKLSSGAPTSAWESPDAPMPSGAFREVLREESGAVAGPTPTQPPTRQEDAGALSHGFQSVPAVSETDAVPPAARQSAGTQVQVYRIGSPKAGAEAEAEAARPLQYPEPQGDGAASGEADGDLLDALVRRMEASARRYPQDLAQEGGEPW